MFLLSNIKNSIKFFFILRTKSTEFTGSAGLGAKNDQPVPSSAGSAGLRHLCSLTDSLRLFSCPAMLPILTARVDRLSVND
jgi:hypothetical protein